MGHKKIVSFLSEIQLPRIKEKSKMKLVLLGSEVNNKPLKILLLWKTTDQMESLLLKNVRCFCLRDWEIFYFFDFILSYINESIKICIGKKKKLRDRSYIV